ncbi:hypothetical protein [Mesorhizobium sp. KR9-304]|uniref:hypothetical protein n=1 Tax=Mesorhizobium sp. KR9-304 TaxID=3156614 RepID=UPI0032B577A0
MLNAKSISSLLLRPEPKLPALQGPALVIGSGPGAKLPDGFNDAWTIATVNASQVVASSMGCGSPDLTLFGNAVLQKRPVNREAQSVLRGLSTGTVIWQTRRTHLRIRLAMLGYSYSRISVLDEARRIEIVSSAVGRRVTHAERPSNGILLALLCLHMGSSIVVMTGFSLTQAGHAYNDKGRVRNHVDADNMVLAEALARGARIYTSDPLFSSESGIPLFGSATES